MTHQACGGLIWDNGTNAPFPHEDISFMGSSTSTAASPCSELLQIRLSGSLAGTRSSRLWVGLDLNVIVWPAIKIANIQTPCIPNMHFGAHDFLIANKHYSSRIIEHYLSVLNMYFPLMINYIPFNEASRSRHVSL